MSQIEIFLKELESESQITRKMLQRIPDDSFTWQPHPKSMTIKRLSTHIADIFNWVMIALTTDELDFQNNPFQEPDINSTDVLLSYFESSVVKARACLENAKEETLDEQWVMRSGSQVYMTLTKGEMIRVSFNQEVHHRAQLGVFLRLLDVPIPGSYGPSADELEFA